MACAWILSNATNIDNINKNGARTAGAKVAPFLLQIIYKVNFLLLSYVLGIGNEFGEYW